MPRDSESRGSTRPLEAVMSDFRRLDFHDSRLVGFALRRVNGASDRLTLFVQWLKGGYPHYEYANTEVIFHDCDSLHCEMNLVDKLSCADAIHSTGCELVSVADSDGQDRERIE